MNYEDCVYSLLDYYDDNLEIYRDDLKKLDDYYISTGKYSLWYQPLNKRIAEMLIDKSSHLDLSEGAQDIIDDLNESKKLNAEKYKTEKIKIKIDFACGECRLDPSKACDYMIGYADGSDGKIIELYAEYEAPEGLDGTETKDVDAFDHEAYPELKEEIIEQAANNGIPAEALDFFPF